MKFHLKGNVPLLLFLIFWSAKGQAQITYESTDFATTHDSFTVSKIGLLNIGNFDYKLSGPNVVWDYTGFNPVSQEVKRFADPNRTGFRASYFLTCNSLCYTPCYNDCINNGGISFICAGTCTFNCNATCLDNWINHFDLAELTNDSLNLGITTVNDVYNFYDISNDALSQVAIGAKISGFPLVLDYQNYDRIYKFPMAYSNVDSSFSNFSLHLDSIPGTGINISLTYSHGQFRHNYVEGWGTLKTPFGEFQDVIKLKSVIRSTDSVTFQGNTYTLNEFLPSQIVPDSTVEFSWFSKDFGIPLLKVTAWVIDGNYIYQDLEYIDSLRCFDPASIFGYLPFPAVINDGEDSVEVNFYNLSINGDSLIWFFDDPGSTDNSAFDQNPSHWYTEEGRYNVELITCNTACRYELCDTFSIPVFIIDMNSPATGFGAIDPNAAVNIFPNPFRDIIYLNFNSGEATSLQVNVFDVSGKKVKTFSQEKISEGKHLQPLDLGNLSQGFYLVNVITDNSTESFKIFKGG